MGKIKTIEKKTPLYKELCLVRPNIFVGKYYLARYELDSNGNGVWAIEHTNMRILAEDSHQWIAVKDIWK
jgi:hypothetical protein